MSTVLQDLRFALRQLRRSPGFALTAVLTLALGIAANVIVFGVLKSIFLDPLDAPHADRVITFAPKDDGYPEVAYPEVRDVRDGSTVFSGVAADAIDTFGLEANGVTRPVWGDLVSGQYFEVMGTKPLLGRLLQRADDDHPGASEAAVLTYPAWKNYFGGDPDVVGKTVRINKHPYTVVGVTPDGFYGSLKFLQPDLFVPMANEESLDGVSWLEDRHNKVVFPMLRIKDGITLTQVQAELDTLAARVRKQYPKEEDGLRFRLAPPGLVGNFLRKPAQRFMAGILGLAGIVLLAACANLGSLFAARTADRTREIAIRMAVGSSRWRVVRQVLVEAMVIALAGGACACGLSWMALRGLAQWHAPTEYPMQFRVEPQPSLILVGLAIAVAAGAIFGVAPLQQIFKADPNDVIKGGSQASGGRRWSLRDVLLAAQVALCCVTVTAAAVSLRGLGRTLHLDRGFDPYHAVLTKFDLVAAGYSVQAAEIMQRRVVDAVAQLPGVEAVGYANGTPLFDTVTAPVFTQQTTDLKATNKAFEAYVYAVSPGYFAAAGTPLLAGRYFRLADTAKTPRVAVVNRQFARSLFHTEHALGRSFKDADGKVIEVVGMVADGKYFLPAEDPQEAVFFPIAQQPSTTTALIVRTRADGSGGSAKQMAATVEKTVRALDPAIPIKSSSEWIDQLAFNLFPSEVATVALGLFGAFGLLLSVTGTFGLASYTVTKRLRELSIRVALGAQGREILKAALGRMLVLLASGSAAGLLLGLATGKVLSAIVFQATAQDPVVLGGVVLTILMTGVLSVAAPVRRALRADPAELLREQ